MTDQLLPTTVVGSYSVPEWLERLKTDYHRRRLSAAHLNEIHETAIKAAVKDQELAGIDIVSDGELRRDNDVDYLLARMPGVRAATTSKSFYFDYYDLTVTSPLGTAPVGLAAEFRFTHALTDRPVKFSLTGPFSLSRRLRDEVYGDRRELVLALAHALNAEARALVDAGASILQIDEPFLAGYPEQVGLAVEAINIVTAGVEATWALHVCYGNRYARPSWEGHYTFLFPAVLEAGVDQLVLEFARKGDEDLPLVAELGWDRALGLGVLDVKSDEVETPEVVATRIRRALKVIDPDKLVVNPDCGLRHVPPAAARAKLQAMVEGTARVRAQLQGTTERAGPLATGAAGR